MAANKFATILHRNTNKIIVILVYAVLEWVLILLLLLNSFFNYLITKFAKLVGLKPPCPWCSRLDHILEPQESTNLQRDLVCEAHATEISNLGFCSNHHKLAETERMCEDCLASRPNHHHHHNDDEIENSFGLRHRIAFISWVTHNNELENGENVIKKCSCCNKSMSTRFYPPPCLLMKPSWGDDGDYASKGTLIVEAIEEEEEEEEGYKYKDQKNNGSDHEHEHEHEHQTLSDFESFILREMAEDRSSSVSNLHSDEKDEKEDEDLGIAEQDRSLEVMNMNFEKYQACETHRLIPLDLIDCITCVSFGACDSDECCAEEKEEKIETFASESQVEAELVKVSQNAEEKKKRVGDFERLNISMTCLEDSIVLEVEGLREDSMFEMLPQSTITTEGDDENSVNDGNNVEAEATMEETDNTQAFSDAANLSQSQEPISSYECTQEDESSTSDDDAEVQNAFEEFITQNNLCNEEETIEDPDNAPQGKLPQSEEPTFSYQCTQEDQSSSSDDDAEVPNAFDEFIAQNNLGNVDMLEKIHEETIHQSPKCCEANEVVEEEEEEDKLPETPSSVDDMHYRKLLGVEESVEEGGDPVVTIELLKTALKTERKVLSDLYQELEEERSASAVAANQTMAMITRLQEEKAAMQMEALQYQRVMEEQTEYDQEALQLLNELMTKREKEKQELEKELEEFKQKVLAYEAKEKLRTCSNNRDSDDLSIDLNKEAREEEEEEDTVSNLEEMTLDCVKQMSALDDSLAEFEEERVSILDQLKALEEKLITLGEKENLLDDDDDGIQMNRFLDDMEYSPRRTMDSLAKRLLPEFETQYCEAESTVDHVKKNCVIESKKKVSIEEEVVDHVYERLKAIETEPLEDGDKGSDLLQEVFQHLRDLKAVELRLKNLG
ncbi:myosin-binding protein 3-like [Senna tora]|uniref:Myosin-binding protein 3-like n=1 Tax=Senna tora TaxID=362788 RepID=A0A834T712_9FABA|nr:myosin-binding protein 3-like [Senna tora]